LRESNVMHFARRVSRGRRGLRISMIIRGVNVAEYCPPLPLLSVFVRLSPRVRERAINLLSLKRPPI